MNKKLLEAYCSSDYEVQGNPAFILRIGQPSPALDRLLEASGASGAAFLTAANPRSVPRPAQENRAALEKLEKSLKYPFRRGEGRARDATWREPSLLVIGIPRAEACALGRQYGQNAIVYADKGRVPELVVLT